MKRSPASIHVTEHVTWHKIIEHLYLQNTQHNTKWEVNRLKYETMLRWRFIITEISVSGLASEIYVSWKSMLDLCGFFPWQAQAEVKNVKSFEVVLWVGKWPQFCFRRAVTSQNTASKISQMKLQNVVAALEYEKLLCEPLFTNICFAEFCRLNQIVIISWSRTSVHVRPSVNALK